MNSDVVKPTLTGLILSYLIFWLIALALLFGIIWLLLTISPLVGLVTFVALIAGGCFGGSLGIGEIMGEVGGAWFVSALALRLKPEQVESRAWLRIFFHVDRSTPLTNQSQKAS